ncbi:hypothetical protein YTPLAS72_15700 [Nitrospira sp.]|nr:hypothetical protein YTPLAS72_15700 [Nitrospira sp.]
MTSVQIKPSDYIKALVCGFASPVREKRLLIMLVAYIDDSGSNESDNVFVLAGFISTAERWMRFSDAWDALCRQDPQTPDFKMKVAERLKGKDTYWGNGTEEELIARRDAKVQALANVIENHAMCRISAGMDWNNYREIARGNVPAHVDSPYFFLFWNLIAEVANHQQRNNVREKVDFVFDEQGALGTTAVAWHPTLIATLPPFMSYILSSTPIFRDDAEVLPLKAADMLAWQMRRYVSDSRKDSTVRPALATLLNLPHIHANIDRGHLAEIVREVNHAS